jgi:lysyl-tRNA synthetase class 2
MTDWRPVATLDSLRQRARMVQQIRAFFEARNVLEVSTPVITRAGITDPNIDSLALACNNGYLRTSPEYAHKRLLAAGFGDLFELGPVFRANENGQLHRSEFTLLEWYRVDWSWQQLAEEVVALIRQCLPEDESWQKPPRFLPWRESFERLDPLTCTDRHLRELTPTLSPDCDRDMRLDYLFATTIQPSFPDRTMTVVHGYPASQAALARLDPADPRLAERFEVFFGPIELANGYRELTAEPEQRRRFEQDNARRKTLGRPRMPLDEHLLAALRQGLPECSGVAMGVDRLFMAATGSKDIAEVVAF